jgi:hypothetical protein
VTSSRVNKCDDLMLRCEQMRVIPLLSRTVEANGVSIYWVVTSLSNSSICLDVCAVNRSSGYLKVNAMYWCFQWLQVFIDSSAMLSIPVATPSGANPKDY